MLRGAQRVKCIDVAQYKVHWRAVEVTVMYFLVAQKVGNFWNRELIIRLSEMVLLCEDG